MARRALAGSMRETIGSASSPPRAAALAPPALVPGDQVVRALGRGGYGEVYEAIGAAGVVAIKVLRADRAVARENVARFEREIRCVGLLEHPAMPRLLELGALP